MQPAKCPLASPQGWIFDKDVVIEYIAKERDELKERYLLWEEEQRRRSLAQKEQGLKRIEDIKQEMKGKKVPESSKTSPTSFWVAPESTSSLAVASESNADGAQELNKPDLVPRCPMSGAKLRYKELIPVHFERCEEQDKKSGAMYCCGLSKKRITHQQAVLLKPSGVVILESVFKTAVEPTLTCPVSGKKLSSRGDDVIRLQTGGTSFSAHSKVEAKKDQILSNRSGPTKNLRF